ncbi:MAG: histidine kinase [Candidatus Cloacimonadales bacterium]|nr:histidine kinase [Candidatus Cloacimonadales bacterium]
MIKNKLKLMISPRRLGILLLINLIICFILTILTDSTNQIGRFKMFQLNWIFSNSIGFSIYFFLHMLDLVKLRSWLKIVCAFLTILLASIWGGFLGTKIISLFFEIHIKFFKSANFFYFLTVSLVFGASAYVLFILLGRIQSRKLQWLEEKHARTEAELTSLRTRINPHFLFNTLNSISGLIHAEPNKADDMLQQLSELLRYNLRAADIPEIGLEQEIQAVREYLEIEKIRLGERLEFSISNSVNNFKLPPLLLLTLVENAIKHGISPSVEGGKVEMKVEENSQNIELTVFNTGNPLSRKSQQGFGLKALIQLLEIHYQGKANFDLTSIETGTLAKIVINTGGGK